MDLSGTVQNYINGQAAKQLAPYSAYLPKSGSGLMASYSASASSSASSGPSKSGDISGGTAFNIGGINLGTQYPTAVSAQGSDPLASLTGGASSLLLPAAIAGLALVLFLVLRK